ncbi:hypothetical protein KW805_05020 [Candidatus Pacearchaeota archaeon]|nr:hypothetical protein [Candidatus Pacearchaeota archaeon]
MKKWALFCFAFVLLMTIVSAESTYVACNGSMSIDSIKNVEGKISVSYSTTVPSYNNTVAHSAQDITMNFIKVGATAASDCAPIGAFSCTQGTGEELNADGSLRIISKYQCSFATSCSYPSESGYKLRVQATGCSNAYAEKSIEPTSSSQLCTDSDGDNPFTKGMTKWQVSDGSINSQEDYCVDNKTVSEGYCGKDDPAKVYRRTPIVCENGCHEGVCIIGNQSVEGGMDSCLNDPTLWWDQQTNKCYKGFSKELIASSCSDPDGGINKYSVAHTFGFRSVFADSRDQRIRTGGKDGCVSDKQLIEHYCDDSGFIQTTYVDCPRGCQNDACVKGPDVTETVTCTFKGSTSDNKCYLAGQFTPEDRGTKWCTGTGSCAIKFTGEEGEKITWKSSCGEYQYTTQDGSDETVTFECKSGATNPDEIKNKGFMGAYYKCYDGKGDKQTSHECKPSRYWYEQAIHFCKDSPQKGEKTGGVNSFGVTGECYLGEDEDEHENVTIDAKLVCKDSCPLDNKCYPFGYRKGSNYCADSGSFEAQVKGDSVCENNFQCSSNVCVSNKCVSEGFIEKVMNWFKKLFGSKE